MERWRRWEAGRESRAAEHRLAYRRQMLRRACEDAEEQWLRVRSWEGAAALGQAVRMAHLFRMEAGELQMGAGGQFELVGRGADPGYVDAAEASLQYLYARAVRDQLSTALEDLQRASEPALYSREAKERLRWPNSRAVVRGPAAWLR